MASIYHHFIVNNRIDDIFDLISSPSGISKWWSKGSNGVARINSSYELYFGEGFNWEARVTKLIPNQEFELTIINASEYWINTKVGFNLKDLGNQTEVNFYHSGWLEESDHFKISSYCWAMYLRVLKRYLEYGEEVPYEYRLET